MAPARTSFSVTGVRKGHACSHLRRLLRTASQHCISLTARPPREELCRAKGDERGVNGKGLEAGEAVNQRSQSNEKVLDDAVAIVDSKALAERNAPVDHRPCHCAFQSNSPQRPTVVVAGTTQYHGVRCVHGHALDLPWRREPDRSRAGNQPEKAMENGVCVIMRSDWRCSASATTGSPSCNDSTQFLLAPLSPGFLPFTSLVLMSD